MQRSFQQAKCVVSGRNEIDFNQRAYNYIAAVVVTDADNSQPSCLPVLQFDYISLSPCPKPVSLSVCLCLSRSSLGTCYLPSCPPHYKSASCLKSCSFCLCFFHWPCNKQCNYSFRRMTYTQECFCQKGQKQHGSLGMAAQNT